MESSQILSWVLGAVGIFGFYLAGKKVWWSWYVNLGCQTLWFAYAILTSTPAFAATALFYTLVFGRNAITWTRDRKKVEVQQEPPNLLASGAFTPNEIRCIYLKEPRGNEKEDDTH